MNHRPSGLSPQERSLAPNPIPLICPPAPLIIPPPLAERIRPQQELKAIAATDLPTVDAGLGEQNQSNLTSYAICV